MPRTAQLPNPSLTVTVGTGITASDALNRLRDGAHNRTILREICEKGSVSGNGRDGTVSHSDLQPGLQRRIGMDYFSTILKKLEQLGLIEHNGKNNHARPTKLGLEVDALAGLVRPAVNEKKNIKNEAETET